MTAVETALASAGGLLDPAGDAAVSSVRHVNIGVGKGGIRKKRCRNTKAAKRPCDVKRMMVPQSLQLQRLFLMCRQVFKGPGTVPSDCDVERLCRILDDMMPEDVGLSSNLQFFNPKGAMEGNPRVTNTTIYKGNNFSLCIFFLPSTSVIPLHNHPGMTVFSKLLLGRMHIKAYDWADVLPSAVIGDSNKDGHAMRLARLKANKTFTPQCNTSVLYPTSGGNIHEFRAITPCAVLDVLGPPYSKDDGRDCSYYKDIPYDALSRADGKVANAEESDLYGWLEEIEIPEESKMDVIQYLGPQVV